MLLKNDTVDDIGDRGCRELRDEGGSLTSSASSSGVSVTSSTHGNSLNPNIRSNISSITFDSNSANINNNSSYCSLKSYDDTTSELAAISSCASDIDLMCISCNKNNKQSLSVNNSVIPNDSYYYSLESNNSCRYRDAAPNE